MVPVEFVHFIAVCVISDISRMVDVVSYNDSANTRFFKKIAKILSRFFMERSHGKETIMNTDKITTTPRTKNGKAPTITRKIGNTTFDIHVHFSETSKETFTDKF